MALNVEQLLAYGPLGLFIVAFFESMVFPIPPDVLLLPMCMVSPRLSWWYAFLTSSASVLGGLLGYAVGKKAGRPVVRRFLREDSIREVEALFAKYGGWAVGIAAFTPLPYKVFTFGAGIFRVSLWTFTVASVAGRSARFFLEGALVYFLGDKAQAYLGANFEIATVVLTAVLLAGTVLFPRLLQVRKSAVGKPSLPGGGKRLVSGLGGRVSAALRGRSRSSLAWALSAAAFAVLGLAFLEDMPGPEREALNVALDPVFSSAPFSIRLLGASAGLWPALAVAGIAVRGAREHRPRSRFGRYLVYVASLSAASWATEAGAVAYLASCYGGAPFSGGGPLLAPAFLLLGSFLLLERSRLVLKACGMAAAAALALGRAGQIVFLGAEPVVGMTSLIISGFVFCLWSAVLSNLPARS